MNRRTYMWKVGGLAVVMVAVVIWLFGCSRESIEDVMEGGALSAPEIAIAVSSFSSLDTWVEISIFDDSTPPVEIARYRIDLVDPVPDANGDIPPSATWCYEVTELFGKGLSHWMLLVGCLVAPPPEDDHIISSSPPGTEGCDGSTGKTFCGIKWDAPFPGNRFCITLDGIYPAEMIEVLVKTATFYNTGWIAGPACEIIQHNDLSQGTGGMP